LKRKIIFILLMIGLAAAAWSQGWGRNMPDIRRNFLPPVETVTVSGSMTVARGFPAVKSGDVTYIVSGINRLIGFIDGLKEGTQVTIEGTAMAISGNANMKYLRPSKLTLGGKTYDMATPGGNLGMGMGPQWGYQTPPRDSYRQPAPPAPPAPPGRMDPRGRQIPNGRQRWNFM
jgi:hypothetical protein